MLPVLVFYIWNCIIEFISKIDARTEFPFADVRLKEEPDYDDDDNDDDLNDETKTIENKGIQFILVKISILISFFYLYS